MNCCSGEQLRTARAAALPSSMSDEERARTMEFSATKEFSVISASSATLRHDGAEQKQDTGNIEEAEVSLRENGSLNNEEARALLGRYEYQKGNTEAALRLFEGIDVPSVIPKLKSALARRTSWHHCPSPRDDPIQRMSPHAATLLLEAIYLKAKSFQSLTKFEEAAMSCKVILDVLESSFPEGLQEVNSAVESKLQDTVGKAVELLPMLWTIAQDPHEAMTSYRRALLFNWGLDADTIGRIQRDFAVFLLYSGNDVCPPSLRSQMAASFVPSDNYEEAVLLLMILLRKMTLKWIPWDPSVLDHLCFALSLSGDMISLADHLEGLLPGMLDCAERYHMLGICYYVQGQTNVALNLLHRVPDRPGALLLISKTCFTSARRAVTLPWKCVEMEGVARSLLAVSLSSRSALTESDRLENQRRALDLMEAAGRMTAMKDPSVVRALCSLYADQRRPEMALLHARRLMRLEMGSEVATWLLLARVLSALGQHGDAEAVVDTAIEQTTKRDQSRLLRMKARLRAAVGMPHKAIESYTQLLVSLRLRRSHTRFVDEDRHLEMETWHDLACLYISMSRWHDADVCLAKCSTIDPYCALTRHAFGKLYDGRGFLWEAFLAFMDAVDIEPVHVASLVSAASVLRRLGHRFAPIARSLLMEALRLDRMNHRAWFHLGMLYSSGCIGSPDEAIECFQAAVSLEQTAPIEP